MNSTVLSIGRPRAVFRRDQVLELPNQGMSWKKIACQLGVSTGTARRGYLTAKREHERDLVVSPKRSRQITVLAVRQYCPRSDSRARSSYGRRSSIQFSTT